MKINKKEHGTAKQKKSSKIKTGKFYSTGFKKRTIHYYLLGMYNESAI